MTPWQLMNLQPLGKDDGIVTYTGKICHPTHPSPSEICIEDIAGQLSKICRFTGCTQDFYSVAQHSLLVCRLVPFEYKLLALLHDASEAYINDIAKPYKAQLTNYKETEHRLMNCIFKGLNLPFTYDLPEIIKEADLMALAWEQREFIKETDYWPPMLSDGDWKRLSQHYGYLTPLSPKKAEMEFLLRYNALREAMEI